jgi:beta-RFAP synthase
MAKIESVQLSSKKRRKALKVYPRLHLFSLDLSLLSGHLKSGSMGISLVDFPIKITVTKSKKDVFICDHLSLDDLDNVLSMDRLRDLLRVNDNWRIVIHGNENILKSHVGLGISTQLAVGILRACANTSGTFVEIDDIFKLGVGHVSALGLKLAFSPGFMLETGYDVVESQHGELLHPELCHEYELPEKSALKITRCCWYLIYAVPKRHTSLSAKIEEDFWQDIFPDTKESSYQISYDLLNYVIPGLVVDDYQKFLIGMKKVTSVGTKPMEESIQSEVTKKLLMVLRKEFGFATVSSIGPTIYAFAEANPEEKLALLTDEHYDLFYMKLGRIA